ncbi:Uncharacterised protein [Chlamydia trachomatis]|nr:Uncharacterised protein [Chlamydia trachomatis]
MVSASLLNNLVNSLRLLLGMMKDPVTFDSNGSSLNAKRWEFVATQVSLFSLIDKLTPVSRGLVSFLDTANAVCFMISNNSTLGILK